MQDIEKLREQVDQIHIELVALFRRRLALTEKIWQIKKANQVSLIDQKREDAIIHRFDGSIPNSVEQKAVQGFLKSLLIETKNYLEAQLK